MGPFITSVNLMRQLISRPPARPIDMRRPFRWLTFCVVAGGLTGCGTIVEQRGDLPDPAKVATIRSGATTRDAVSTMLGTPSSVAAFDPNTWYYISSRFETHTFTRPELVDQEVTVIKFNDANVVTDVEHRTLKDSEPVEIVDRATPSPGHELTFLEQLIGNLGRFNKTDAQTNAVTGGTGDGRH